MLKWLKVQNSCVFSVVLEVGSHSDIPHVADILPYSAELLRLHNDDVMLNKEYLNKNNFLLNFSYPDLSQNLFLWCMKMLLPTSSLKSLFT
jgi:hypothetical protein